MWMATGGMKPTHDIMDESQWFTNLRIFQTRPVIFSLVGPPQSETRPCGDDSSYILIIIPELSQEAHGNLCRPFGKSGGNIAS